MKMFRWTNEERVSHKRHKKHGLLRAYSLKSGTQGTAEQCKEFSRGLSERSERYPPVTVARDSPHPSRSPRIYGLL